MADRRHAEISEVLGCQLGQGCLIDRVFPECLLIAFQAEAAQSGRNVHGIHTHTWPYSSTGYSCRHVGRAPSVEPLAAEPSHQNEIASLPYPMRRNTILAREALKSSDQFGNGPVRSPHRTAFSLTVPPTLLAPADEVIE